MSWVNVTLQVRTPLFGGDDPASDSGTPIRVPSIRGALRFWFRALAAGHGGVPTLTELWAAEQAVFGSTDSPSPIRLRVAGQPVVSGRGSKPGWAISEERARRPGFDGAQYLLGQGLWDYRQGLRRGCVEPGAKFTLGIRFSDDEQVNAQFMLALWAWLTYGGLGARTRRGFGQLVCTAVDGAGDGGLPGGWTHDHLRPPADAADWADLGDCAVPGSLPGRAALGWGDPLPGPPPEGEPLPEFPTLAPRWWAGCLLDKQSGSLGEALHRAGLRWRQFRAVDDSRKPSQSTRSPEWTHVIHGADERYPLAAFGLPVGYFSRSQGTEFKATVTPDLDGVPLRRASPVWLRPVQLSGGRWGVFTHVFYARLLPAGAELRITGGTTRTLPEPLGPDVEEAWDRWLGDEPRLSDDYYRRS